MGFFDEDKDFGSDYASCEMCPRACRVDRTKGIPGKGPGFCGETDRLRVAYVGPHFGEEPPITGTFGSGAVFFSGCSMKCEFCQNHQISSGGMGNTIDSHQLLEKIERMVCDKGVHNVNFVTPDHFIPHVLQLAAHLKTEHPHLPMLYNLSGYQSLNMLRRLESVSDMYLPDFKYSDPSLAGRLSACPDYPEKAIEAISEMVRQKGFLDALESKDTPATKGVMVRHLILPGAVENSINALTMLLIEFGPELPISLMSQYHPVMAQKNPEMNRKLTEKEFDRVYDHARKMGFEFMFVQFLESCDEPSQKGPAFVPDFTKLEPFD